MLAIAPTEHGADWEDRTPDPGVEDQYVASTPSPQSEVRKMAVS
jgi:hypothetical protein